MSEKMFSGEDRHFTHKFESSSIIKSIDYDRLTTTLTVEFVKGVRYVYTGVPQDIVEAFVKAKSAGNFFVTFIKESFNTAKIE